MLKDIVFASALDGHRLRIRYEDGVEGIFDLKAMVSFRGVFAPLKDPGYFSQVRVDPELGTVSWPNGADLNPDVLYGRLVSNDEASARKPFVFDCCAYLPMRVTTNRLTSSSSSSRSYDPFCNTRLT